MQSDHGYQPNKQFKVPNVVLISEDKRERLRRATVSSFFRVTSNSTGVATRHVQILRIFKKKYDSSLFRRVFFGRTSGFIWCFHCSSPTTEWERKSTLKTELCMSKTHLLVIPFNGSRVGSFARSLPPSSFSLVPRELFSRRCRFPLMKSKRRGGGISRKRIFLIPSFYIKCT